jgi:Fur family transcriptional regulator, zinc uptake regulator
MRHEHRHDAIDHPHGSAGAGGCAHATDHAARAPRALADAEGWCRARGLRLTPIRRAVLEALYATHRPMSAYDIVEAIAGGGERRLAAVTIYRALDFLTSQGFAHRLASRNAFIACPFHHGPADPVVFLICERCGGVDEAVCEDLSRDLAGVAERVGFVPRSRVIELAGLCAHCRG